jgi:ATP synthase protein I
MVKIASSPKSPAVANISESAEEGFEAEFQPMTAEQAQAWRQQNPTVSPWRVLALQVAVGALVAVLIGLISGQHRLAASAAWGSVAVVVPAVVFVRALSRQMQRAQPGSALVGLFVWELVKVILTVALLLVAPKVVSDLSWFALVAGFVVTMKVYWLAMALGWMQPKSKPNIF